MTEGNEVKKEKREEQKEGAKKVPTMNIKLISEVKLFFQFFKVKNT